METFLEYETMCREQWGASRQVFSVLVLVLVLDFSVLVLALVLNVNVLLLTFISRQSKAVSRQHSANEWTEIISLHNSNQSWRFLCKPQSQCLCHAEYSSLRPLFTRLFSIPATSAYVERFYPRDAMLVRSLRQRRVCPSVCHTSVLCENGAF